MYMNTIVFLFIFSVLSNSVYSDTPYVKLETNSTDDMSYATYDYNTEETTSYSKSTNDYTDEMNTSETTPTQDSTTTTTTTTKSTTTTTIGIFYRPSIKLNLELGCNNTNCTFSLCKNETALFSLEIALKFFICEKFSSDLMCEVNIGNIKTCNSTLYNMIFYELEMKPGNSKDLDEIKDVFQEIINVLEVDDGEGWNQEFNGILMETGIELEFNFSTDSFIKSYAILNSSNECDILTCTSQYFSPICSNNSNFVCQHLCETTNYCLNNGECFQSITYEPICK